MTPDVLMLDRIGGAYTPASLLAGGLGGSEIEVLQVARGLTAKGHTVVVANGVDHVTVEDGITFVPHAQAWQHIPRKALYLQRFSAPSTQLEIPTDVRVVVRANDQYCPPYDVHRALLTSGRAGLVANTQWQAAQFGFAKEKTIIPPMLEPMPKVKKQRGLFVFASGALKGFEPTIERWQEMRRRYLMEMRHLQLALVNPGWGVFRPLTVMEENAGIRMMATPNPHDYRRWIAKAEGLFMVSTMPETFCCAAALAERAGTRTHILCAAGIGGLWTAVQNREHITEDPAAFEAAFVEALTRPLGKPAKQLRNLTPDRLIEEWEDVLQMDRPAVVVPVDPLKVLPRADGRPTVGLVLIAKGDEASTVVTRAIYSAKKAGVDCCTVVCDADDATADVARSVGADVFIRPSPRIDWDAGHGIIAGARNEALTLAEPRTDYVLSLDADDWFEGTIPATLDHDAYEVLITDGGLTYPRVQLFRSALHARYAGIIHEVLQLPVTGAIGRLSTLTYRRGHSSYGYQDQDPAPVKFAKHAHLARKWLLDHPDDARMQFYLARSLQDAGQLDAARVAYSQRCEMVGWDEERAYAWYQVGVIQMQQGADPTVALLQAYGTGVPKAEPLVLLARWYRDDARRQFVLADLFARQAAEIPQPTGALFTQPSIYQFEAAAEVAIMAYWLGRQQDALERFEALQSCVPADRQPWLREQIAICVRDLSTRRS